MCENFQIIFEIDVRFHYILFMLLLKLLLKLQVFVLIVVYLFYRFVDHVFSDSDYGFACHTKAMLHFYRKMLALAPTIYSLRLGH